MSVLSSIGKAVKSVAKSANTILSNPVVGALASVSGMSPVLGLSKTVVGGVSALASAMAPSKAPSVSARRTNLEMVKTAVPVTAVTSGPQVSALRTVSGLFTPQGKPSKVTSGVKTDEITVESGPVTIVRNETISGSKRSIRRVYGENTERYFSMA